MPVRAIVIGITLIMMTAMLVFMTEFFLPLSMKADMDMLCRSTLLKMESSGGLSADEKQHLQSKLENKGLADVEITATSNTRQGSILTLHVECEYTCNRMTSLFKREDVTLRMVYDKASMSRRVVN